MAKKNKTELTEYEKDLIRMFAEYDLNETKIAKVVAYHRNSVRYQVQMIEKKTNLSPKKFYDLIKLLDLIEKSSD